MTLDATTNERRRLRRPAWRILALAAAATTALAVTNPAAAATPQKFKDWTVQCLGDGACIAHLDLKGVQILVGRTKAAGPVRMAFRLALSAKAGEPVTLRLTDGWQAGLRVAGCTKSFCEAGVAANATDVAISALSRNRDGLIAYKAGERILLVPFSLAGFNEAVSQVKK